MFLVERDAIVRYELDHARQLQRLLPRRYTPYLAHQLSEYAKEFQKSGLLEQCRQTTSEAVDLTRWLHDMDPEKYTPILAERLSNYGSVLAAGNYSKKCYVHSELVALTRALVPRTEKKKSVLLLQRCWAFILQFASTRIAYEVRSASVKMTYELHLLNPTQYLITLADRLEAYGTCLFQSKKRLKAGEAMAECVKLTRDLHKLNPEKYVADIASWREKRGVLLLRDSSLTSHTLTRASGGLSSHNPLGHIRLLSRRLNLYAKCLRTSSSRSQSSDISREAVEWGRELYRSNPHEYVADLANHRNTYGLTLHGSVSYLAACEDRSESVARTRKMHLANPDRYAADLASGLNDYGLYLQKSGAYRAASKTYSASVQLTRELHRTDPDRYAHLLALRLDNLGVCLLRLRLPTVTATCMEQAYNVQLDSVEITRELHHNDPNRYAANLACRLSSCGSSLHNLKSYAEACEVQSESVNMTRELHRTEPNKYAAALAFRLHRYGLSLHKLGSYYVSCEPRSESVAMTRKLHLADPAKHAHNLARRLNHYGMSLYNSGSYLMASNVLSESLDRFRRLHKLDPKCDKYRRVDTVRFYEASKAELALWRVDNEFPVSLPSSYC